MKNRSWYGKKMSSQYGVNLPIPLISGFVLSWATLHPTFFLLVSWSDGWSVSCLVGQFVGWSVSDILLFEQRPRRRRWPILYFHTHGRFSPPSSSPPFGQRPQRDQWPMLGLMEIMNSFWDWTRSLQDLIKNRLTKNNQFALMTLLVYMKTTVKNQNLWFVELNLWLSNVRL